MLRPPQQQPPDRLHHHTPPMTAALAHRPAQTSGALHFAVHSSEIYARRRSPHMASHVYKNALATSATPHPNFPSDALFEPYAQTPTIVRPPPQRPPPQRPPAIAAHRVYVPCRIDVMRATIRSGLSFCLCWGALLRPSALGTKRTAAHVSPPSAVCARAWGPLL